MQPQCWGTRRRCLLLVESLGCRRHTHVANLHRMPAGCKIWQESGNAPVVSQLQGCAGLGLRPHSEFSDDPFFQKNTELRGVGRPWEVDFQTASHEQSTQHLVSPGFLQALCWVYVRRQALAHSPENNPVLDLFLHSP